MTRILKCYGCGASEHLAAEVLPVGEFVAKRCAHCASITTEPMPSEAILAAYYAGYSAEYSAGMSASRYRREMPKRWNARLRRIARHQRLPGRELLDLGGANGMFASLAHEAKYTVSVYDYVPEPVDLGFCKVQPGDLSRRGGIDLPDASFDVVTLWSCIEHVRDPDAALSECVRLVKPGGLVAIDTPLVGDRCETLFAARSHWISPPEHLNLFSARGLIGAVQRAGLSVVSHEPFHERTMLRWVARRARNVAVAARGVTTLIRSRPRWESLRVTSTTAAGDIQLLIARRA